MNENQYITELKTNNEPYTIFIKENPWGSVESQYIADYYYVKNNDDTVNRYFLRSFL